MGPNVCVRVDGEMEQEAKLNGMCGGSLIIRMEFGENLLGELKIFQAYAAGLSRQDWEQQCVKRRGKSNHLPPIHRNSHKCPDIGFREPKSCKGASPRSIDNRSCSLPSSTTAAARLLLLDVSVNEKITRP